MFLKLVSPTTLIFFNVLSIDNNLYFFLHIILPYTRINSFSNVCGLTNRTVFSNFSSFQPTNPLILNTHRLCLSKPTRIVYNINANKPYILEDNRILCLIYLSKKFGIDHAKRKVFVPSSLQGEKISSAISILKKIMLVYRNEIDYTEWK